MREKDIKKPRLRLMGIEAIKARIECYYRF